MEWFGSPLVLKKLKAFVEAERFGKSEGFRTTGNFGKLILEALVVQRKLINAMAIRHVKNPKTLIS